jgi:DNA-binding PadR family transcriptional regulator
MEKSGWIEEPARRGARARTDPRRKYYRLTGEGRERLKQELERLSDIVAYARARDLLRDPEAT